MSKINKTILGKAIDDLLAFSKGETIKLGGEEKQGKVRNFRETIELQVTLKNYDIKKDKRFSGTFKLPQAPRDKMKFCMLANAKHAEVCEKSGIEFLTEDQLKTFKKNKKLVKKLGKKYDAFLASDTLIKKVPKLLGPTLNRLGKFPTRVDSNDAPEDTIDEIQHTIKFQLKKILCLNIAVGHVEMTSKQITLNIQLAVNFLATLLKKGWMNIGKVYIKSSMGPSFAIYF